MRMRDADLLEMRDIVEDIKNPLPVRIRVGLVEDARHPYPYLTEHYERVANFGTAKNPAALKKEEHGLLLTVTETVHQMVKDYRTHKMVENPSYQFPTLEDRMGYTMDPNGLGPMPPPGEADATR
jgi:hypothetical protein